MREINMKIYTGPIRGAGRRFIGRMCVWMVAVFAAMMASGCSEKEDFTVSGRIEGLVSGQVTMYYYAQGGMKSVLGMAVDGKFKLHGQSASPTLVTLITSPSQPPYYVVASNGESIEIEGKTENPLSWTVKGNKPSKALADFVRDNAEAIEAGNYSTINSAVARYVTSHKSDIGAAAILVTRFHVPGYEMLADSLLRLLNIDARPTAVMQNFGSILGRQVSSEAHSDLSTLSVYAGPDSLVRMTPSRQSYALVAFTSETRVGRDSIQKRISLLCDSLPVRRFRAFEISLAPDSASWRAVVNSDSVAWPQAWVSGGVAAPQIARFSVPRLPYFIVCDSTGHQLYRGSSITAATEEVERRLGVKF